MRDLVEYIVKQLVSKPEEVSVDEMEGEGEVNLTVTVDPADMGIVIGKSGQTIKAIRKIVFVRALSEGKRVNLRLNEPENPDSPEQKVSEDGVASSNSENPQPSEE